MSAKPTEGVGSFWRPASRSYFFDKLSRLVGRLSGGQKAHCDRMRPKSLPPSRGKVASAKRMTD